MATVSENSNVTLIIKTQYAYDFEVRSLSSETLVQCFITSYKVAEHGTYVLKIGQSAEEDNQDCPIVQIGDSIAIIGLIVWIVFIVIIELCCYIHRKHYFDKLVAIIFKKRFIEDDGETMLLVNPLVSSESNHLSNKTINTNLIKSKRFQALDACRGLNTMLMIFIAYGGGGYSFLKHAIWNGLNLEDIVFPWFVWMIGFSIVLSQRSLRAKKFRKRSILFKFCRRTAILFVLAMIVLFVAGTNDDPHTIPSATGGGIKRHGKTDLSYSVLHFWMQWLCILLITTIWLLITFFLNVPGCPKGYLGPGGDHEHGKYRNCTGGAALTVDQFILTDSHMGRCWTCRNIYNTQLSFESEVSLGTLMGIVISVCKLLIVMFTLLVLVVCVFIG